MKVIVSLSLFLFLSACSVLGDKEDVALVSEKSGQIELGEEYSNYSKRLPAGAKAEEDKVSWIETAAWYLPNRVLDLIDIFRIDVGVGPALGAVVRVTKYGQAGVRAVAPFSLRAGLAGRRSPVFLETSSEFGAGPAFAQSADRVVEAYEVGLGADIFAVGAYLGINFGEIPDFFSGIVGADPSSDDY